MIRGLGESPPPPKHTHVAQGQLEAFDLGVRQAVDSLNGGRHLHHQPGTISVKSATPPAPPRPPQFPHLIYLFSGSFFD